MYDLQTTLSLHQQGKIDLAAKSYRALLAKNPNDINVNFLYGKLLNDTQQFETAKALLNKAFSALPDNKNILFEFAKCLLSLGDARQVISVIGSRYKESVDLSKLLLQAQHRVGTKEQLKERYKHLLATWSNSPRIMMQMAQLSDEDGDLNMADQIYSQILNIEPDNVLALHNLATVKRRLEMPSDALLLLNKAQQLGLDSFQLFHNMGNAYSDLNKIDKAVAAYLKTISINPNYMESYKNLVALYAESGNIGKGISLYENALSNINYSANAISQNTFQKELVVELIKAYTRVGKTERATTLINDYFADEDVDEEVILAKAKLHDMNGELTRAFNVLASSQSTPVILQRAEYALRSNNVSFVFENMPKLALNKDSAVLAKAYLTIAERMSGVNGHRQTYCQYEELVKSYQLPENIHDNGVVPFCKQLAEFLSAQHTAKLAPLQQTLNGGTQTRGNIFGQTDNALLLKLKKFCEHSISEYLSKLSAFESPHQYLPNATKDFKFIGAWSVNLSNQGYHTNHVHPEGNLSAVFYVDIPDDLDIEKEEGHLIFGKPNFKLPLALPHEYSVAPQVGKLVIFPSYFWHGTIPFHSSGRRLTIAFDVSPTYK
ncbi:putative 2OG-Fe(II) oxygenase [Alteromonas hispanica]|uniref:Uncharacterized protein n=1 Tax=Alteromonas hispanica TaxID=315421 RepID=A0A6L9MRE1_9ALTE|nr:putative 2OG-Fe(II) oxygenase [Alteromonas hispanica]NDW20738.1 hypothetical protein [Alteromonas hispanica]